jgi:hypothetical protein
VEPEPEPSVVALCPEPEFELLEPEFVLEGRLCPEPEFESTLETVFEPGPEFALEAELCDDPEFSLLLELLFKPLFKLGPELDEAALFPDLEFTLSPMPEFGPGPEFDAAVP